MTDIPAATATRSHTEQADFRRLMLFFALVYATEGICQGDGLIAQPLNYYLKEAYAWTPVQIAAFLTVLNLPWFLKPLYGAASDFVPLFGYRRKSYLVLANAMAVIGYFAILTVSTPAALIFLLLVTAYGMAIASTLCGAILVENGQKFHASAVFVNQQWLWFNIAAIVTAILGGQLIERLTPLSALQGAAALAAIAPISVMFASLLLIEEEKSAISLSGLRDSLAGLMAAMKQRRLWVIALFLLFYYFSPGIDTPLYFYQTDALKFSQGYIGVLNAIGAAGWIAAAILYGRYLRHIGAKPLLYLSIATGVVGTLTYAFLFDPVTAAISHFLYGGASAMTAVATLSLAADHCPERSEGFSFALLMSATNLAGALADNVGSFLYERVFDYRLYPLILVAAAFTAVNFLLVPLLKLGQEEAGSAMLLRK